MYGQRIGALPPYNELIGSKMVALSIVSNEIRKLYEKKHDGLKVLIWVPILNCAFMFHYLYEEAFLKGLQASKNKIKKTPIGGEWRGTNHANFGPLSNETLPMYIIADRNIKKERILTELEGGGKPQILWKDYQVAFIINYLLNYTIHQKVLLEMRVEGRKYFH